MLVLLIVRVVSFEWRNKSDSRGWQRTWLGANVVGSVGAPFLWGIALSNLLRGVPLDSDRHFAGSFWDLFSPYTVFAGLVTVALFAFHGAIFLTLRIAGEIGLRAAGTARRLSIPAALGGTALVLWTVAVAVDRNDKDVFPPLLPAMVAIAAFVGAVVFTRSGRPGRAFTMTAVGIVSVVATLFTSLYPRVLVSAPEFANSLTVESSSSSHYALGVMTVAALILTPLILLYQGWTYHVFRARLGGDTEPSPADLIPRETGA